MPTASPARPGLGAFLRASRDRLTPAQAGIDALPGPRRVPGLRKEEVAHLAGMSTDHYSRIEQGRQRALTPDVLDALARALQLDEVARAHLGDLAAPVGRRSAQAWTAAQRPEPGMLRLMTALDHVPVLLLGRNSVVLARNALLAETLGNPLAPGAVFLRWLFLDPAARARIVNWSDFAAAAVGGLRLERGRRPRDAELGRLIGELRAGDPDLGRWWDDQRVADRTSLTKLVDHPVAGPMTFGIETVVGPHDPEQRLVVYTVEPASPTAAALALLASWTGDPAGRLTRAAARSD